MYASRFRWWAAGPGSGRFGAGCGPHATVWGWDPQGRRGGDRSAGGFGVRRPLRFLAFKLDLSDEQIAELAKILDDLKTERAQAEVDRRRTLAAYADAVNGDAFDEARASAGAALRVESASRIRDAVLTALRRIHAVLDPEQRSRFAYLIRTGRVTL